MVVVVRDEQTSRRERRGTTVLEIYREASEYCLRKGVEISEEKKEGDEC